MGFFQETTGEETDDVSREREKDSNRSHHYHHHQHHHHRNRQLKSSNPVPIETIAGSESVTVQNSVKDNEFIDRAMQQHMSPEKIKEIVGSLDRHHLVCLLFIYFNAFFIYVAYYTVV